MSRNGINPTANIAVRSFFGSDSNGRAIPTVKKRSGVVGTSSRGETAGEFLFVAGSKKLGLFYATLPLDATVELKILLDREAGGCV